MPHKCINIVDNCCYVCEEVTFSSQKRAITPLTQKAYFCFFYVKLVTRRRAGHRIFVAITVLPTFKIG